MLTLIFEENNWKFIFIIRCFLFCDLVIYVRNEKSEVKILDEAVTVSSRSDIYLNLGINGKVYYNNNLNINNMNYWFLIYNKVHLTGKYFSDKIKSIDIFTEKQENNPCISKSRAKCMDFFIPLLFYFISYFKLKNDYEILVIAPNC